MRRVCSVQKRPGSLSSICLSEPSRAGASYHSRRLLIANAAIADARVGSHVETATKPNSATHAIALKQSGLTLLTARHEGEPLEQVHVLLVLDQRAVQRRDELLGVALAQRLRADILDHEQLEPVEQLRG